MAGDDATASTGDETLDGMLGGGFPRDRATLLVGGPGTGKSTLAMQFLQEGLDAGEDCLYVSTEQTIEELRDSFAGYEFDLDHENLAYTSVHATPGRTLESDEEELTLQSLEGGELLGEGYSAPFTGDYVQTYLERHAPRDRVVFDSVSGLGAVSEDREIYRRTVLDLIRFFTDEFGATTLFTAEEHGDDDAGAELLQFTAHGVLRLVREPVVDDLHRFLEITKMRGVDHDRRRVELEFVPDGVRVGPYRRSQPPALKTHRHRPTGVAGLDALCGGGLVVGVGVLLQHDGRANLNALYSALLGRALDRGFDVVLAPTIELREDRLAMLLSDRGDDLDELLAEDRLAVLDAIGGWDAARENVYGEFETAEGVTRLLGDIHEGREGPTLSLVNADTMVHALGEADAREVRYFQEAEVLGPEDSLVHVSNPAVVGDQTGSFYADAAEQVLRTWMADDGLQYLTLEKSPCGFVGSTSLVEYTRSPPYLRVQDPPQTRENTYTEES